MTTKLKAILSLVPNAQVAIKGDEVTWHIPSIAPVTDAQIDAEVIRLQAEYDAKEYQRKRASEYPDFKEYLDGIVKGDEAQIADYIAKCQAIKQKYPKEQA